MDVTCTTDESYQKLFLRGYPIKLLIPVVMKSLDDVDSQKKLMESTVGLSLVKKYPLKVEYMQSFLKSVISELETEGKEVCDELYETCCELLNSCNKRATHHRHYMLSDTLESCITIEESTNIIGQGTTGLHTWQASQALVNWCTSHKFTLQNKCVLELGSGIGLAGLAVSCECEPLAFWFTDCHPSVLGMLLSNVKINVDKENELELCGLEGRNNSYKLSSFDMPKCVEENILYQGKMKNTQVFVMNLPWEDVPEANISKTICPDVVLAADVVYDTSMLEVLCTALSQVLNKTCIAVIACTIRNEDTINKFLDMLGNFRITVDIEEPTESFVFLNLEDLPVRIFKLSRLNSS